MKGKKGMEMWYIVLIILALVLFLAVILWYSQLGDVMKGLVGKLGGMW